MPFIANCRQQWTQHDYNYVIIFDTYGRREIAGATTKKKGKFSKKPNLKTHEANSIHYSAADVAYLKLKNDQITQKLMSANMNKASTSNPNEMICIDDSLFQFVEPISTVYSIQRKIETAFPQTFSFAEDSSYMTCNMCKAHISLAAKNYLWSTKQHVESCSTIKQVNFISTHIHFTICYFIIITFRSHWWSPCCLL